MPSAVEVEELARRSLEIDDKPEEVRVEWFYSDAIFHAHDFELGPRRDLLSIFVTVTVTVTVTVIAVWSSMAWLADA
jgi:hypothetical protein